MEIQQTIAAQTWKNIQKKYIKKILLYMRLNDIYEI